MFSILRVVHLKALICVHEGDLDILLLVVRHNPIFSIVLLASVKSDFPRQTNCTMLAFVSTLEVLLWQKGL